MPAHSQLQVQLFRDSFDTPWGFRLQGGNDLGHPLSVQRVFSNSPAEGELQRGDVIVHVNGRDSDSLTHKQAQDLIKFGGGTIALVIQRPPSGRPQAAPAQPPKAPAQSQGYRSRAAEIAPTTSMPLPGTFHGPLPPQSQPTYGQKPAVAKPLYGGGPSVGLDYNRPQGFVQQQQQQQAKSQPASHPSPRKAAPADPMMLNRVQESLQHSIGYQPVQSPQSSFAATPAFHQSAPPFQTQTSQQSPAPGQYQQPSPTYQTQISSPFSQPEPQAEEDDYEFVPVWERRKAFLADEPKAHKPVKPARGMPKPAPPKWKPPSLDVPRVAPPPRPSWEASPRADVQAAPSFPSNAPALQSNAPAFQSKAPAFQSNAPAFQSNAPGFQSNVELSSTPAWRDSLKKTGTKPWDTDIDYVTQSPSTANPPRPPQAPSQPSQGGKQDELRDWNQSELVKMIKEEQTSQSSFVVANTKPDMATLSSNFQPPHQQSPQKPQRQPQQQQQRPQQQKQQPQQQRPQQQKQQPQQQRQQPQRPAYQQQAYQPQQSFHPVMDEAIGASDF